MWRKLDFIQLAMTSSMLVLALSKAKLAPKKGHGHCLMVCCWSDTLQLSESQWNHYIWEVCSAAGIRQQKGLSSSPWQCPTARHTTNAWMNWATKFYLICHIHLTSRQLTTTSSSISITFCRENASITSKRQKMLSKSSLNPEARIFMLQEEKNLFLIGKNVLIVMVPILINKDVFGPSYNDLKFTAWNHSYVCTSLIYTHVLLAVHLKLSQYCWSAVLQYKIKKFSKNPLCQSRVSLSLSLSLCFFQHINSHLGKCCLKVPS